MLNLLNGEIVRITIYNRVLLLLSLLLIAVLPGLPFLTFAPNRLAPGSPLALSHLLHGLDHGIWLLPVILLLFSGVARQRIVLWLTLLVSALTLFVLFWLSGREAFILSGQGSALARTSFGSGLWLAIGLCMLITADTASRLTRNVLWRLIINLQLWLPIIVLLWLGHLNSLALLKEYSARQDIFDQAFSRHLLLLFATLLPALLLSVPVGIWCVRQPRWQSLLFSLLNIIQTIPAVALFGLLIAPLAGLARHFPWLGEIGINGIGIAPAVIALTLYALLPLVRSVATGLAQVPPRVVESAHGMGMTRWQVFIHVEVPLALPVLLSGMRVVTVQTLGMTVIAALIGAGGFGAIIFQGLLSSALELVLLGVIPVVVMAVIADALFKFIISSLEARRR